MIGADGRCSCQASCRPLRRSAEAGGPCADQPSADPCAGSSKLVVLALTNPEGLPADHMLVRTAARLQYSLHLMLLNTSDAQEMRSPYSAKLPKAVNIMRAERCRSTVFMMVDAFDCFFYQPAHRTLQAFYDSGSAVVWAAEPFMPFGEGVNRTLFDLKARIPASQAMALPADRVDCEDSHQQMPCPTFKWVHRHRYLNAGGVIGYRDDLLRMFREILSVRMGAQGWRDRRLVCGEASGRKCAEQWAALRVLSFLDWRELNVSLDYHSRLFYTAPPSLSAMKRHLQAVQPSVVHSTMIVAPRVNFTLQALLADIAGIPWAESNGTFCAAEVATCAERAAAVNSLCRALTACLVLNATASSKSWRRKLDSAMARTRTEAVCSWHRTEWPALPPGPERAAIGHLRYDICLKTWFPRASARECQRLHHALKVPSPRPVDPCAQLNATVPSPVEATSRGNVDEVPSAALGHICRGVMIPQFWSELRDLFTSRDRKRWLYGAALGDEPTWTNFSTRETEIFHICYFNTSTQF